MIDYNYKLKYIEYKNKYKKLNKIYNNMIFISNKILILPNQYKLLTDFYKNIFEIYEFDISDNPISYINKDYLKNIEDNLFYNDLTTSSTTISNNDYYIDNNNDFNNNIMDKHIITPDEYFILSDSNKSKFEINESDYDKFPNRVVPKNYKKFIK
jgi:hypothetical protein